MATICLVGGLYPAALRFLPVASFRPGRPGLTPSCEPTTARNCTRGSLPCRKPLGRAVRSYRTFSPLPRAACKQTAWAVYSLWHFSSSDRNQTPRSLWPRAPWCPDFPRSPIAVGRAVAPANRMLVNKSHADEEFSYAFGRRALLWNSPAAQSVPAMKIHSSTTRAGAMVFHNPRQTVRRKLLGF